MLKVLKFQIEFLKFALDLCYESFLNCQTAVFYTKQNFESNQMNNNKKREKKRIKFCEIVILEFMYAKFQFLYSKRQNENI